MTPEHCGARAHYSRREFVRAAGSFGTALCGVSWLTAVSQQLALAAEKNTAAAPRSLIILWLQGGPSQLETFDPHPGTAIGGETKAISTSAKSIQIASTLPRTAEQMHRCAVVRSIVTKEGDHERGTYNLKTGFRPLPGFVHPSIGAVLCHQLPEEYAPGKVTDIPRHVSILSGQWSSRGGYLGDQFDAFQMVDPKDPVPDVRPLVDRSRFEQRVRDLEVVEDAFALDRSKRLDATKTLHRESMRNAMRMMDSDQLAAFDVASETLATRERFGDHEFGRGCLAAARLTEKGVRCVEVTLSGWDSHANNHEIQGRLAGVLDSALSALLFELAERELLDKTLVLCGGEFGRTPKINPAGGRDHWPHGFSLLLAGGNLRQGCVLGETDTAGEKLSFPGEGDARRAGIPAANIHATLLKSLGIDQHRDTTQLTPDGRAMRLCDGQPLPELLT